jgi:hypothetical protein
MASNKAGFTNDDSSRRSLIVEPVQVHANLTYDPAPPDEPLVVDASTKAPSKPRSENRGK